MIFIYLVNLAWGFSPEPDCDPNLDNSFFSPMSMHKEFNSTCITLVAFFDPKHFLVENGAPESIYFLTPNRQYAHLLCSIFCCFDVCGVESDVRWYNEIKTNNAIRNKGTQQLSSVITSLLKSNQKVPNWWLVALPGFSNNAYYPFSKVQNKKLGCQNLRIQLISYVPIQWCLPCPLSNSRQPCI